MRYRCPACGTRRTDLSLLIAHKAKTGHTWCICSGDPVRLAWSKNIGKHRPGSPGCIHWDGLQVAANAAWDGEGGRIAEPDEEIPF